MCVQLIEDNNKKIENPNDPHWSTDLQSWHKLKNTFLRTLALLLFAYVRLSCVSNQICTDDHCAPLQQVRHYLSQRSDTRPHVCVNEFGAVFIPKFYKSSLSFYSYKIQFRLQKLIFPNILWFKIRVIKFSTLLNLYYIYYCILR